MVQTADELREEIEIRRELVGRDLEAIGEKVSPGRVVARKRNELRSSWTGLKDRVMGSADDVSSSVGDSVSGAADSATGALAEARDRVGEAVSSAPEMISQRTAGSPLVMGAIAFGAGFVIAGLLPPSRTEQDVARQLEPNLQTAARQLTDAGREAAEHLKDPAREAVEQVAETAREAVTTVGHEAQSVAQDTASSAPETLRS